MHMSIRSTKSDKKTPQKRLYILLIVVGIVVAGSLLYAYQSSSPSVEETIQNSLVFEDGFSSSEQQQIHEVIKNQHIKLRGEITARVNTTFVHEPQQTVLAVFVPVTTFSSGRQSISTQELQKTAPLAWHEIDTAELTGLARLLNHTPESLERFETKKDLTDNTTALIPLEQLDRSLKLLSLDNNYFLDTFNSGALFRTVTFSGEGAEELQNLQYANIPTQNSLLSFMQTGVTALTREMQTKLEEVGDPLHFSKNINQFLSSADITHTSNEVSFLENCTYSRTSFCSDPRFLETLKDSGIDVVELTGNHNNDRGRQANAATINTYRALGWHVVGGGLNASDARQFYQVDQKGSRIALLAYNFPDAPDGIAIASPEAAGANPFDLENIEQDIMRARQQSEYIIVNVQYWECYSYPDGYVEYPECDAPIGEQESYFKKLIDLGADMVVGSSAHQPQTYELYNGKPIYYGLGNLYFDQTQWPGTERSIILTHYFLDGKLLQTKLTPTRYDENLQPYVLPENEAVLLLTRLQATPR